MAGNHRGHAFAAEGLPVGHVRDTGSIGTRRPNDAGALENNEALAAAEGDACPWPMIAW